MNLVKFEGLKNNHIYESDVEKTADKIIENLSKLSIEALNQLSQTSYDNYLSSIRNKTYGHRRYAFELEKILEFTDFLLEQKEVKKEGKVFYEKKEPDKRSYDHMRENKKIRHNI